MLEIRLSKQAADFLAKVPSKHARQMAEKILAMSAYPETVLSEDLKGHAPFRRIKSGEYRVIFFVETDTLHITLIGKRNDDEIYKQLARLQR